jgi:hypothetical protein
MVIFIWRFNIILVPFYLATVFVTSTILLRVLWVGKQVMFM